MCILRDCDAFTSFANKHKVVKIHEDWDTNISREDGYTTLQVVKDSEIFGYRDNSWGRFLCLERWRHFRALLRRELFGGVEQLNLKECCKLFSEVKLAAHLYFKSNFFLRDCG